MATQPQRHTQGVGVGFRRHRRARPDPARAKLGQRVDLRARPPLRNFKEVGNGAN